MQGLGYDRYGAHGGDFGAGVATHMALVQPDRMIGIHLSTPEMSPYTGPGRAAAVGGGAGVRRPRRALGRDRARLQRGAVDPAADTGVRAQRLACRPGRLGARQMAFLVGHRRRPRRAVRARRSADHADDLVGHRVDHLLDARLLRQPLARHEHRRDGLRHRAHRDGRVRQRVRARGASRRGRGTSGSTTSNGGRCSRAAGISPRPRSPSCWPTTSPSSSPTCRRHPRHPGIPASRPCSRRF